MTVHRRFLLCAVSSCLVTSVAAAQSAAPAGSAPPASPAPAAAPPPATTAAPPAAAPAAPPGAYYAEPAQAPSQPAQQPQTIFVEQPPLPPLQPKSRYYHDGFYLRLSTGYAYLNVSTSLSNGAGTSGLSGSGGAFDVLVGGTPAPGLVVGGGLLSEQIFDPGTTIHTSVGGVVTRGSGSLGFGMLGPFVDAFPMPAGGFHFGGMLGLAANSLRSNKDNWSGGLGLSLWMGYLWWVSSQWSLGIEGRYTGAWTTRKVGDPTGDQFDATDSSQGFALLFSAAYH
jgi:hypothetical protein